MRYLISDIHGCYDQYRQLLQKINFSSQDELYVLGDAVDRGSDPIKGFDAPAECYLYSRQSRP